MTDLDALHARAKALNLHGLLAHWTEAATAGWVADAARLGGAGARPPQPRAPAARRPYRPLQAARATSTGPGPNAATAPPSKR